jgi:hypothetical protein
MRVEVSDSSLTAEDEAGAQRSREDDVTAAGGWAAGRTAGLVPCQRAPATKHVRRNPGLAIANGQQQMVFSVPEFSGASYPPKSRTNWPKPSNRDASHKLASSISQTSRTAKGNRQARSLKQRNRLRFTKIS